MNTTIRTKKKLVHVNNGAMLSSTQVPLDTLFLWEFNFVDVILETMQFLEFVQSAGFFLLILINCITKYILYLSQHTVCN